MGIGALRLGQERFPSPTRCLPEPAPWGGGGATGLRVSPFLAGCNIRIGMPQRTKCVTGKESAGTRGVSRE